MVAAWEQGYMYTGLVPLMHLYLAPSRNHSISLCTYCKRSKTGGGNGLLTVMDKITVVANGIKFERTMN